MENTILNCFAENKEQVNDIIEKLKKDLRDEYNFKKIEVKTYYNYQNIALTVNLKVNNQDLATIYIGNYKNNKESESNAKINGTLPLSIHFIIIHYANELSFLYSSLKLKQKDTLI